MPNIFITGITGQDGTFLTSELLKDRSNFIIGTSRQLENIYFQSRLSSLKVSNRENLKIVNINLEKKEEILELFSNIKFDYIYNLSGPSSVYKSLKDVSIGKSIETIFNNLIDACIKNKIFPNFFQASSSEMFATSSSKLDENSPLKPRNPYSTSKMKNHLQVIELRNAFEWNIYSGILFNHESEFRSKDYLFPKIINQVKEIKDKKRNLIKLGSLDYERDWSFAGDIAIAIEKINKFGKQPTYVVGSGKGTTIKYITDYVFDYFNLNPEKYIEIDDQILRPFDPIRIVANPNLINKDLNWKYDMKIEDLINRCINFI